MSREKREWRRQAASPTILRLIRRFGYRPTDAEIAHGIGLRERTAVGHVLREARFTPHLQERIAKWAGMTRFQLFGRAALHKPAKPGPKGPRRKKVTSDQLPVTSKPGRSRECAA